MPQIIAKNIREEDCAPLAARAFPALADACACPVDWFTLDAVPARFYGADGPVQAGPVLQVWWFRRPKEMKDAAAAILHRELAALGYAETQISFHVFEKDDYYENGTTT